MEISETKEEENASETDDTSSDKYTLSCEYNQVSGFIYMLTENMKNSPYLLLFVN